jgi:hypothetical protein
MLMALGNALAGDDGLSPLERVFLAADNVGTTHCLAEHGTNGLGPIFERFVCADRQSRPIC